MKKTVLSLAAFATILALPGCSTFWKATPHILKILAEFEQEEATPGDCSTGGVQVIIIDTSANEQKVFCVPPLDINKGNGSEVGGVE